MYVWMHVWWYIYIYIYIYDLDGIPLAAFFLGWSVSLLPLSIVDSAVATINVCFAEVCADLSGAQLYIYI